MTQVVGNVIPVLVLYVRQPLTMKYEMTNYESFVHAKANKYCDTLETHLSVRGKTDWKSNR